MTQSNSRVYRLGEIVESLGGKLVGTPDLEIRRIATLENAGPADLTFLSHPRYRRRLQSTRAGAIILKQADCNATSLPKILCDDPYLYFARVARLLNTPIRPEPGVHPQSVVEPGAIVSASATVGPWCHIGRDARVGESAIIEAGCAIGEEVEIGEDSHLHPAVTIYPRCRIGTRVIIHSGAVIGADGFGMALDNGRWLKIPQTGRVIIGDDVEIGANTTIDRGALDDTVVEDGVKLDNQIQIGHNVRIGAHTAMAGCVGIAGSARIGRHCTVGGGALIVGHIEISDHVNISAATLVTKSIARPGTYTGVFPIAGHREWARMAAHLRGVERMAERIQKLEQQLSRRETKKR